MVDDFEAALCEFTGAPYCVTVDSCTNALFLCFAWWRRQPQQRHARIGMPRRTYVGVCQAAQNAGVQWAWESMEWSGSYQFPNTKIVDSAKRFERGMYSPPTQTCVSFQAGKLLPIGRGGAILHDDPAADRWFRRARLDGRTAGADYQDNTYQFQGFHMYMPPDAAARGLWLMTYLEDDDKGDWTEYPDLSKATWV